MRVNRSPVAYQDVRDREKVCGLDQRLGKCSGRFQKHSHTIRVRKVLENPGHTPAAENSRSWAGAAGADHKLLECVGEMDSAAGLAGTVAGIVVADVSRGYQTNLGKSWAICWNYLEPWGSRRAAATKGCSRLENV